MSPQIITINLSRCSGSDLIQLREVLHAYLEPGVSTLGEEVTLHFDTWSGRIFLTDADNRIEMLDDEGYLREKFTCPMCKAEGFDGENYDQNLMKRHFQFEQHAGYCSQKCAQKAGR